MKVGGLGQLRVDLQPGFVLSVDIETDHAAERAGEAIHFGNSEDGLAFLRVEDFFQARPGAVGNEEYLAGVARPPGWNSVRR